MCTCIESGCLSLNYSLVYHHCEHGIIIDSMPSDMSYIGICYLLNRMKQIIGYIYIKCSFMVDSSNKLNLDSNCL